MKRFIFVVVVVAVLTILLSRNWSRWFIAGRVQPSEETIRECFYHLKTLDSWLSTVIAKAALEDGTNLDVEDAIRTVAGEKGYDFFRSAEPDKDWVRINPDTLKWKNGEKFASEVALYSIIHHGYPRNKEFTLVGLNFAGDQVNLTNPPAWNPVPVWELKKK